MDFNWTRMWNLIAAEGGPKRFRCGVDVVLLELHVMFFPGHAQCRVSFCFSGRTYLCLSIPFPICVSTVCLRCKVQDNRVDCPGSQNDRTAFKFSAIDRLLDRLPSGYFIVGDAAYPASDRVLAPYPGMHITTTSPRVGWLSSSRSG